MEELAVTVRQNAHSAQQADDLANQARTAAEDGGRIVAPAMTAMGRIEESSGKISEITTVIEEIAFQTNLLALNAAVEAARAGDAGRGFAVVAAEVRQLAQRTSRSSKEIKEIIQRSNSHVQDGVKMVADVGKSLAGIVDAITSVASIIGEIASASREQSSGLDEVNSAVAQMDEMTQQNAALVEETTAAAHSLSVQAEALVDLVSYFRVHEQADMAWPGGQGGQPYPRYSQQPYSQPYEETTAHEINSLSHRPMAALRGNGPARPPEPASSRLPSRQKAQTLAPSRAGNYGPAPHGGYGVASLNRRPSRASQAPIHPPFDQDADWSEF